MWVLIRMVLSFTKSQWDGFSTADRTGIWTCVALVTGAGLKSAIFTFHDAPRVEPPSDPLASRLHHSVAANHSEGNALLHQQTPEEEQAVTPLPRKLCFKQFINVFLLNLLTAVTDDTL